MKWQKSKVGAHKWVYYADHVYVAARYLYWKGLVREFALLGAHAIELYLKAYLIQKTGNFPIGHDLVCLHRACMDYDDFFKEEFIVRIFTPMEPDYGTGIEWIRYVNTIKYPEAVPGQKRFHMYGVSSASYHSLDEIAAFVKRNIDTPPRAVDTIENLLKTETGIYIEEWVHERGTLDEVRKFFLQDNKYFKV